MKTIIGLTGSFGSGCSYIANEFILKKGYSYLSLSQVLRDIFKEENGEDCKLSRHDMQKYGNSIREKYGSGYLAQKAAEIIKTNTTIDKWLVDGIRNPYEVTHLRFEFSSFYLLAVYADYNIRWERVKETYADDERVFRTDDIRDSKEEIDHGQRVRDCYAIADIIISNNKKCLTYNQDYDILNAKIDKYLSLIENKIPFQPSESETIMSMAYANSLRSSCMKRKVGAVIIDSYGNIFSSGYNEVPVEHRTCKEECGKCYRDHLKENYSNSIYKLISDDSLRQTLIKLFNNSFKILDYCRALHAEENAILNIARFGSSAAIIGSTLYTTTYPCNLCANKIVQVGITKIVYLEPYPMPEAKKILADYGVEQVPFEGVAYSGYFKF